MDKLHRSFKGGLLLIPIKAQGDLNSQILVHKLITKHFKGNSLYRGLKERVTVKPSIRGFFRVTSYTYSTRKFTNNF